MYSIKNQTKNDLKNVSSQLDFKNLMHSNVYIDLEGYNKFPFNKTPSIDLLVTILPYE